MKDPHLLVKDAHLLVKDSRLLVKDSSLLVKDCHLLVKDCHLLVKDSRLLVKEHKRLPAILLFSPLSLKNTKKKEGKKQKKKILSTVPYPRDIRRSEIDGN